METNGAQFSLIQSLRTGNVIVDLSVAMLVPALFRNCLDVNLMDKLRRLFGRTRSRRNKSAERTISCLTKGTVGWLGNEQRNHILQKAIKLYLTQGLNVAFPGKAQVQLTALHDTRQHIVRDPHDPMAGHTLTWIAAENEWIEVEENVYFRQYKQDGNNGSPGQQDQRQVEQFSVFELSCSEPDGAARVDAFINRAVDYYRDELSRLKDNGRWMYTMVADSGKRKRPNGKEDASEQSFAYKRYRLSEHKTFDSLFFPEKDSLLRLLGDFQDKRGKYAIAGFPHKMGLLLHGPPGTGKTSLIKALAHHTGRSIINVSLAQIETNQALHDVMYDLSLEVLGIDSTTKLTFKDIIFVIEDVDACSRIVQRRDGATPTAESSNSPSRLGDYSDDEAASTATAPRERPTAPPLGFVPPPPPPGMVSFSEMASRRPSLTKDGAVEGPVDYRSRWFAEPDQLNLAGLLNVLDGVVDTPGRMVVMTSNHPEKLDPALIRPGRIDRCLLLDYLTAAQAVQMLAHYFAVEVNEEERTRLARAVDRSQLTPAAMEQLCAEFDSVSDLLDRLENDDDGESAALGAGVGIDKRRAKRPRIDRA